MRLTQLPN